MQKIIGLLFLALPYLSFGQSEEQGIISTVNDFLDGGTQGDVNRFKNAFLKDAVQKSVSKEGAPIGMSIDALASKIKPGQVMERSTKIISWSYAGDAAVAITETAYASSKIIDILNLVKTGGSWKIASRVYSRIENDQTVTSSVENAPTAASASSKTTSAPAKKPAPKTKAVVVDDWR